MKKLRAFDIFGNIAVAKFPEGMNVAEKKKFANKILKEHSSVRTILEKVGKFSGRLRTMKTKYVVGEKNKEVLYRENGCVFRFNIDTSYFSSRLSNERKEVAAKVKKKDKVLVMFAGVAPFSITIAKKSGAEVWSNEINREANKYGKLNIELNKLKGKVHLVSGDVKRVVEKIGNLHSPSARGIGEVDNKKTRGSSADSSKLIVPLKTFDVIVMPRPNLTDTFLKEAFKVSKKGTRIFYYGFCEEKEKDKILEQIKEEAGKAKKKIKILKATKAGEIGPYRIRLRVEFRIL
jgi:tRNA G37 N-methylase Trm5